MTVPVRTLAAALSLTLSACATPGQPSPPTATPQQLLDRAGSFAQPTQDGRLAVLKAQMDAAGFAYTVESFTGRRTAPALGYNVAARVGPEHGREILLVAHYDAVVLPGGKLVDGVVDNAASVVAMIEATIRVAGRTQHPVRVLLTDQEELGLVGAKAWIEAHGITNLAAVVVGDVNADGDALMYGLNNGPQSAFINKAAAEVCAARAIPCLDFPEYPPSDDVAFVKAGAPAISIGHQSRAEAVKLRSFMQNPPRTQADMANAPKILTVIHTPNDTLAAVEPATLAQMADFVAALVMKLDGELEN